jgi:hypothetical protein
MTRTEFKNNEHSFDMGLHVRQAQQTERARLLPGRRKLLLALLSGELPDSKRARNKAEAGK